MKLQLTRVAQVQFFKPSNGYGFLDTETGDLFFHITGYRDESGKVVDAPRVPSRGDVVEYEIGSRNNKPLAIRWRFKSTENSPCQQSSLSINATLPTVASSSGSTV